MFIVFEGGDGSGKTTQARRLVELLNARSVPAVFTHEPGGSPTLGPQLRQILLHGGELGDRGEALLFAAERAEHVRTVVRPALERADVVVCDRFIDSTLAYQGAGRGLPVEDLLILSRFATDGLLPDLVIVCDVPPEVAAARQASRGEADRMEEAGLGDAVRDLLLARASKDPEHYAVVDASGTPDEVAALVERVVFARLA